jgi:spore coat polysaccharide biosynthesis protein SpsF
MGGSDPFDLTLKAATALTALEPVFRARFVIGPGFRDRERLAQSIVTLKPNFETVEGAAGLATEFASCDVALTAFGVTAYELGAFGVPALYLAISPDHALSASAFERAGMGISLGLAKQVRASTIAKSAWSLLTNAERRREMRSAGLATIDGAGAARIAADLAQALNARRTSRRAAS